MHSATSSVSAPGDLEPSGFCLVMTTTATESEAATLAREIVAHQLAACVQLIPIRSFYVWQAQPCDEPEVLLLVKTRTALYASLEAFIRARHSYQTPEILQLPVSAGAAPYLAWMAAQTG